MNQCIYSKIGYDQEAGLLSKLGTYSSNSIPYLCKYTPVGITLEVDRSDKYKVEDSHKLKRDMVLSLRLVS